MSSKLVSIATVCFSMFVLSAVPACALDEGTTDDVESARPIESTAPASQRRYKDEVPAVDGVKAAPDDRAEGSDVAPQDPSTCTGSQMQCNGACVDLDNDPNNCGACGSQCAGACVGGACS